MVASRIFQTYLNPISTLLFSSKALVVHATKVDAIKGPLHALSIQGWRPNWRPYACSIGVSGLEAPTNRYREERLLNIFDWSMLRHNIPNIDNIFFLHPQLPLPHQFLTHALPSFSTSQKSLPLAFGM